MKSEGLNFLRMSLEMSLTPGGGEGGGRSEPIAKNKRNNKTKELAFCHEN